MSTFELAQLNLASMKAPLESPVMAEFVANLDRINALAENSPGFVWRLQTEEGDATALRPWGENILVNMSVWTDTESLFAYTYRSDHIEFMRRRAKWFDHMEEASLVLWWIPMGHRPSIAEAAERLDHLRRHGPGPQAFTFRKAYPPPDTADSSTPPAGGTARQAQERG